MHGSLVTSSLIRETTENESANYGYKFGQEEETYNIVAAHGYLGRLFFQYASEIHALILALHYEARFLRSPDSASRAVRAFENIVTRFGNTQAPAPRKTATRSPAAARTQG